MTYQAGSAQVSVTPDLTGFHKKIAAELKGMDAQFAKAGDSSGRSFGDAFGARLKASFADLPKATVSADADTTKAETQLDALTKKPRSVTVRVKEVADKVSGKTGTLGLAELAGAGAVALGPSALGLGAGLAGVGAAFGAAGAAAGAFGVVAKGMFSDVSDAQKKLTQAQDAYNKATTGKGRAKALADEKKALDGLTPAEKQLATELTALESAWKKLDKAEQPAVGAAIAPWLATATSGMQLLSPLIEDGAGAVQLLGTEAKTALAAPFWGTFFNTLGTTGQISLVNFGQAAGKVGDGVAHLFDAFAPDIDKLPPLVNNLAGSFDKWAKSVTSKGLDDFLSKTFTPGNLALLAKDGKSLGSLMTNIAKATGDMSPLAFTGLSNVLTVLGSLSPGEIEALTGLFLAIKTIGTISKGVSAVSSVLKTAKGLAGKAGSLLGLGGQEAEAAAEGATIGTAEGGSAARAFTAAFSEGTAAGLAGAFATIEGEGTAEAAAAGTSWGGEAGGAFSAALTGADSLGLAAAFAAAGAEGSAEAGIAGGVMGSAMAAGLTGAFDAEGAGELGASLAAGAVGAAIAAGIAGAAIGAALGLGFTIALGATGVAGAVGKLRSGAQSGAADSGTWLQPAGQRAGQGFVAGLNSEQGAARAAAAALRGSVQGGTAGSQAWISPQGRQAGAGFASGLASLHGKVNATAASIRGWVTGALPAPASWLVNTGVSAVQGLANGILSEAGVAISAAESIAGRVISILNSAFDSHSPSRETMKIGVFAGQGLGLGLASQNAFVGQQAARLAVTSMQSLAGVASARSLSALGSLGVPSASAAPSLPGVGSPLRGGPLQLQLSYAGTGNQLTDALVGALQVHIRGINGGDVQAVLGRGPVRIQ